MIRTLLASLTLSLAMVAIGQAAPPSYLILTPQKSNAAPYYGHYYQGYGYSVSTPAYSYGYFGTCKARDKWSGHTGYHKEYFEWRTY
ncbi:hypothetical protein [Blastopirellula marina]|uniref:Uncharacterized protein n=1 Tax=Blastopirellula marina DSM 3645 TaxID=314230 RepID=A3ZL37_9BACT|nr:hypothetical protein [Blastopirellula marina]EAQ82470.1 hypothetical protein DSM3645_08732 [Blastopirellula marina DSM 3645]